MNSVLATAWPRAGLLGNPSDLYEGRGIGFTFADFSAQVECRPSNVPSRGDIVGIEYGGGLYSPLAQPPEPDILQAARVMLRELGVSDETQGKFALSMQCDIPQQLGLSGSSAIIIAALRAVCGYLHLDCPPAQMAELALRAETEVMGIAAGPMDRMVQSFEGLVAMDFASGEVERLDTALMPPVAILMDRKPGQESGSVHAPVRQRWEEGDPEVRAVMAEFRPLVEQGLAYLKAGDIAGLRACVDRNFDLRAQVFPIGKRDRRAIERARSLGVAAKFCGSGGAILAVHEDEALLDELCLQVVGDGFEGIRPQITEVVA
ncbi:MAG: hypothetical protein CMJ94_02860 [Planctomycetes bacterium]|nr:hypothetical protein [Planctomycetota bacterium]